MWKKLKSRVTAVDVLYWAGALCISLGAGLNRGLPLGLGIAGLFFLVGAVLVEFTRRGGDGA